MSKYNHYAQDLQAAFLEARQGYTEALENYEAAKKAKEDAQQWTPEKYEGQNAARRARAEADYKVAEAEFEVARVKIWDVMNQKRRELRSALEKELKANRLANPDDVDERAVKLLESGIMTADDYCEFMGKYDDNPTMLRLIAQYARDAADGTDDHAAGLALRHVVYLCESGQGSVMRNWESLSKVVDYCSGQANGRQEQPSYVLAMANHWEELAGEAVENF